jgi:hypothetical protein
MVNCRAIGHAPCDLDKFYGSLAAEYLNDRQSFRRDDFQMLNKHQVDGNRTMPKGRVPSSHTAIHTGGCGSGWFQQALLSLHSDNRWSNTLIG